jgi:MFS family permease
MLWGVCFFNYADRQAISAVSKPLQAEFHFTEEQLGWIGSAFMWVYAAGAPFAGIICDRFRRKDLILGGCLFWSLVTVTTGWCSQFWHFVTVRALEGFGETFYFPASMALVSDYHSRKTRSRAMAIHQSSVYAGTILGSWLGAWFAVHHGWRSGFYLFGSCGFLLALVLYRHLREPVRGASDATVPEAPAEVPATSVGTSLQDVFRAPTSLLLMLVFAGANSVAAVFLFWTPKFLADKFNWQLTTAGLGGAAFINLASAFSVPFAGWVADRLARRMPGGRILAQSLGLLLGAGLVTVVGLTRDVSQLMAAMVGFGLCKGFYDAGIFASLYDVVPARSRATAAGFMNTVGWLGGASGTAMAGWYADHGGYGSKIQNMSHYISWGGGLYLAGGLVLLVVALFLARHDVKSSPTPP